MQGRLSWLNFFFLLSSSFALCFEVLGSRVCGKIFYYVDNSYAASILALISFNTSPMGSATRYFPSSISRASRDVYLKFEL